MTPGFDFNRLRSGPFEGPAIVKPPALPGDTYSIDKSIKEICLKEGVGEQELRLGVRTRKYSGVRAKIAYYLSHEFGISRAEIARQMGVCTSAIAKAIQNIEGAGISVNFQLRPYV